MLETRIDVGGQRKRRREEKEVLSNTLTHIQSFKGR
jgi:hypothetical protein